ncbi:cold shock domain-containing protein [Kurthia sp. Dielmo]|uniref:cold shock domain-containing protein n=1 Tax=Kurthia sp. Dielmo TaxID=1033738 RepID=UPI001648D2DA|nr:cold shock domain-containing protein [Kurthia sp. Dielmo]
MAELKQGVVDWFNPKQGFGFIKTNIANADGLEEETKIFVAKKNVTNGLELKEGTAVQFALLDSSRGFQATEVAGI